MLVEKKKDGKGEIRWKGEEKGGRHAGDALHTVNHRPGWIGLELDMPRMVSVASGRFG